MAKAKTPTVGPLATPEGRLSFPHLSAPETGGRYPSNKYVATLIIPNTANFEALKAACLQAAQAMWPDKGLTTLGQLKLPFRNGDEKAATSPFMVGTIYIKCKSTFKPPVVGPTRVNVGGVNKFPDYTGPIKGGDYVRLSVTAFPYQMNLDREVGAALRAAGKTIFDGVNEQGQPCCWRPSVTFMLDGVQFLREGAALGGGGDGVKAFDDGPEPATAGDSIFS
jgi:hypothetical protein